MREYMYIMRQLLLNLTSLTKELVGILNIKLYGKYCYEASLFLYGVILIQIAVKSVYVYYVYDTFHLLHFITLRESKMFALNSIDISEVILQRWRSKIVTNLTTVKRQKCVSRLFANDCEG